MSEETLGRGKAKQAAFKKKKKKRTQTNLLCLLRKPSHGSHWIGSAQWMRSHAREPGTCAAVQFNLVSIPSFVHQHFREPSGWYITSLWSAGSHQSVCTQYSTAEETMESCWGHVFDSSAGDLEPEETPLVYLPVTGDHLICVCDRYATL